MDSSDASMYGKSDSSFNGKTHKKVLIVDPEKGPYKTIKQAMDVAEAGSEIRLARGLYQENVVINKPVKLERKDKTDGEDPIIVVSKGPAILVDIKSNELCIVTGIYMGHLGRATIHERQGAEGGPNDSREEAAMAFDKIIGQTDPYNEVVQRIPIEPNMDAVVLVYTGKLYLDDCKIALNFIVKTYKGLISGIVCNTDTEVIINNCEIKGNRNHATAGIIARKMAKLSIQNSTDVHNHKNGGILVEGVKASKVNISDSKVFFNTHVGIHLVGEDFEPLVENCKIERNEGPGIKIGVANKAQILKNEIRLNKPGIEFVSSDPAIVKNKIEKNRLDGIISYTHSDLRCDGLIEKNDISCNKGSGIFCFGLNNLTKIYSNPNISYNMKAGIKTDKDSHCVIISNTITKNLMQGILIVESSSAHVERNTVSENIKANIAFGGKDSVNTTIIENDIFLGRCEGIFVINGERSRIHRNKIHENHHGIVCVVSVPDIVSNKIYDNKFNGVMLLKSSHIMLKGNEIIKNQCIGIYVRDKSKGDFKNNKVHSNGEVDLVVEKKHVEFNQVIEQNQIEGDIRIPQMFLCRIF